MPFILSKLPICRLLFSFLFLSYDSFTLSARLPRTWSRMERHALASETSLSHALKISQGTHRYHYTFFRTL
jgi:hypothetical protein